MKREVYEALKPRITVTAIALGKWHWEFNNDGLNDGLDCFDVLYVDKMCQNVTYGNIWNIAQHVYMFLRSYGESIDARLIKNTPKK